MSKIEAFSSLLQNVVRAVQKGTGEDVKEYLRNTNQETYNGLKSQRADFINTNLRDSIVADAIELMKFNRSSWQGCLIIDRDHKITMTIMTEQTLKAIPRKKNRRIPHYLQTILFVQNADLEAPIKQLSITDLYEDEITVFNEEEYKDDYKCIMEDEINYDDGYCHYVVVYKHEGTTITDIKLKLLDKDCDTVQEYSLMEMLQPDFGSLTMYEEVDEHKTVRDLVLVKGMEKKSEAGKHLGIVAKIQEEKEKA